MIACESNPDRHRQQINRICFALIEPKLIFKPRKKGNRLRETGPSIVKIFSGLKSNKLDKIN